MNYTDWVCNTARPEWQFYLLIAVQTIVIAVTIGAMGGLIAGLLL